jgi:hypothetical protein
MAEKNDKNRETDLKKQEGVVEHTWSHLSIPFVPWRSQVGPRRRLRMSTYKTS